MFSLCLSLGMFAAACVVHVVVWRMRRPRRPYFALAAIFLGLIPAVTAALLVTVTLSRSPTVDLAAIVAAFACHFALAMAYIVTYTAIEADSASLTIALFLADASERGRTREDVQSLFADDFVVGERLTSLVETGCLSRRGERLVPTEKGRRIARLYGFVRRLYRLQVGG